MINEVISLEEKSLPCCGKKYVNQATHTEIVCHYEIIQITFYELLVNFITNFSFASPFAFSIMNTKHKTCDLDDEWLRFFRG